MGDSLAQQRIDARIPNGDLAHYVEVVWLGGIALSQAYQPWVSAVLHETTCSVSVVMVSIRWVAFLRVWSRAQGTQNHACTCHVALIIRYEWCVQAVWPHAHDQRSPGTMTEPLVSLTRRKAIPNYTRRHMKQR